MAFLCTCFLQLEHERVWDMCCYTQLQLRVVTQQWQRDYKELFNRVLVTLEEAKHAHQEELKLQKDRKHQRDVCLQLRKKVCAWNCQILNPKIPFLMMHVSCLRPQGGDLSFKQDSFPKLFRIGFLNYPLSHLCCWIGRFRWAAAFYSVFSDV